MSKLPRRHYYRLDQAAAFLAENGAPGADADYLLHLGATNRLRLGTLSDHWMCVLLPSDYFAAGVRFGDSCDPEIVNGKYPDGRYVGTEDDLTFFFDAGYHSKANRLIGPVVLQPQDLLVIETTGKATIEAGFPPDQTDKAYFFGVSDKPNSNGPKPVVTAEMLIVLHADLQNLIDGVVTSEATQSIPEAKTLAPKTQDFYLRLVAWLAGRAEITLSGTKIRNLSALEDHWKKIGYQFDRDKVSQILRSAAGKIPEQAQ